jgi:hypothetical protein
MRCSIASAWGRVAASRATARGTPLSEGTAPNDLWCADFKGEFKLGNGRYCYPLTVTDQAFTCTDTKSSFVNRVCYDNKERATCSSF